ncbi:hypothetical protein S820908_213 [Synechococcus phage S-CAM9]|uniref:Uncharacterized protein n=1 Tax=Synechococcus phage S-CAM9 TaxID=1883369 RepID=A0A1D8KQK6_9CAUD|nr:hypothetical protein BOW85_gp035 [Synechococcus phage S-CAM9]AOV60360.1 hypothetical protein S050808_213 [Synechococcus phage S-CAM9]AOV60588.1 hypothetical protein S820908_213 [Synechococcus phage S-CAM9]AOV60817.1 hypothetical protein N161109_214 [Synechococcus phage S-CAM9]
MLAISLVFGALFAIGGTAVGFIAGWFANEKYSEYVELKTAQIATHPEMYDTEGNLITSQLTALRVVLDDQNFYYDDEE